MSSPEDLIARFAGLRILVIGDVILDRFLWGAVSRISPEAPVPVVNVQREQLLLGGSANVLRNIVSLGGSATLCGLIGDDPLAASVLALVEELGASTSGLIAERRPTTVKTRVIAQGQQVVRVDREQTSPPSQASLARLRDFIASTMHSFDAVLVSDYAKGVVNEALMGAMHQRLKELRGKSGKPLPLIVDPKPVNIDLFIGARVITPNHHEAMRIAAMSVDSDDDLRLAAQRIQQRVLCDAVLITRGEAGMALLEADKPLVLIPTTAKEVYDVTGAGDTVASTLALGLAAGASMLDAAVLANHAAGLVVGKVGTASVSAQELHQALFKAEQRR